MPKNVSSFISSTGTLVITNLPLGDYVLKITDDCGHEYLVEVNVPEFVEKDFFATAFADCNIDSGAVKVVSAN
ncbi:MAG: hypothetical protein EOO81_13015, partial [Oxalobacteraceae bacterium]